VSAQSRRIDEEEDTMNAHLAFRIRAALRLGALGAIAVAAFAAGTSPALAGSSAKPAHASTKTITFRLYSEVASLVLTRADGTVVDQPAGPPAAGDQLEITENAFRGTHQSHSKKVVATSHTICVFRSATGAPSCDGQAAVGGNQLLLFRTRAGGDTVVSGGTGRFAGATGTVASTEIGDTNNSDLVVVVNLHK
jgi:hypothetical protein